MLCEPCHSTLSCALGAANCKSAHSGEAPWCPGESPLDTPYACTLSRILYAMHVRCSLRCRCLSTGTSCVVIFEDAEDLYGLHVNTTHARSLEPAHLNWQFCTHSAHLRVGAMKLCRPHSGFHHSFVSYVAGKMAKQDPGWVSHNCNWVCGISTRARARNTAIQRLSELER